MNGFVLAAGFGTRLKPITDHMPKALVPVCGRPLLARSLVALRDAGCADFGVNCHYRAEDLRVFKKRSEIDFELFVEEGRIRGTGGGLWFAREFLASDDTFCVCNADIVSDVNLRGLAEQFSDSGCQAALVAVPVATGGTIRYDRDTGEYRGTSGEVEPGEGVSGADFIGIAFYRKDFLDVVTSDDFSVVPVWRRAQDRGMSVQVLLKPNIYWRDTGTPQAYASVHFDMLSGNFAPSIPRSYHFDSQGKRAFLLNLEHPEGVEELVWCDVAAIPSECRITRSVVLEGAVLKPHCHIEDAIVGPWGTIRL